MVMPSSAAPAQGELRMRPIRGSRATTITNDGAKIAYAGITDPARIALAKRRALAEIRAQFGPGARVVGG
jgi:hypothetical protein